MIPDAQLLADLRLALDALPALTWIYTPDRRLLYANRAMREYWGPEGLDDEAWVDIVHPGDRAR
ncbi:MAG: hypothetical protein QOJ89_3819, partial [bacterium]